MEKSKKLEKGKRDLIHVHQIRHFRFISVVMRVFSAMVRQKPDFDFLLGK